MSNINLMNTQNPRLPRTHKRHRTPRYILFTSSNNLTLRGIWRVNNKRVYSLLLLGGPQIIVSLYNVFGPSKRQCWRDACQWSMRTWDVKAAGLTKTNGHISFTKRLIDVATGHIRGTQRAGDLSSLVGWPQVDIAARLRCTSSNI